MVFAERQKEIPRLIMIRGSFNLEFIDVELFSNAGDAINARTNSLIPFRN